MSNSGQFYAGQKFGRYTLIKPAGIKGGSRRGWWYADCDCGFTRNKLVNPYKLKKSATSSCGCLREEFAFNISILSMESRRLITEKVELEIKEMPQNIKDWLAKFGDGDINKGVRRLSYYLNRKDGKEPPKKLFRKKK